MFRYFLALSVRIFLVTSIVASIISPVHAGGLIKRTLGGSLITAGAAAAVGYMTSRATQCALNPSACSNDHHLRDRIITGLSKAATANPGYRIGALADYMEDTSTRMGYHPPPRGNLPGFPGSIRVPGKSTGANGKIRPRWNLPDGNFGEWDWQHGEVEIYDKQGRHKGAYDPETGAKKKTAVPGRRAEK